MDEDYGDTKITLLIGNVLDQSMMCVGWCCCAHVDVLLVVANISQSMFPSTVIALLTAHCCSLWLWWYIQCLDPDDKRLYQWIGLSNDGVPRMGVGGQSDHVCKDGRPSGCWFKDEWPAIHHHIQDHDNHDGANGDTDGIHHDGGGGSSGTDIPIGWW